jgi:hypothetical protein
MLSLKPEADEERKDFCRKFSSPSSLDRWKLYLVRRRWQQMALKETASTHHMQHSQPGNDVVILLNKTKNMH